MCYVLYINLYWRGLYFAGFFIVRNIGGRNFCKFLHKPFFNQFYTSIWTWFGDTCIKFERKINFPNLSIISLMNYSLITTSNAFQSLLRPRSHPAVHVQQTAVLAAFSANSIPISVICSTNFAICNWRFGITMHVQTLRVACACLLWSLQQSFFTERTNGQISWISRMCAARHMQERRECFMRLHTKVTQACMSSCNPVIL